MRIQFKNGHGVSVTATLRAQFHDDEGQPFYVVGPVPQSTYDATPPFVTLQASDVEEYLP